jgi:hypothetical protein
MSKREINAEGCRQEKLPTTECFASFIMKTAMAIASVGPRCLRPTRHQQKLHGPRATIGMPSRIAWDCNSFLTHRSLARAWRRPRAPDSEHLLLGPGAKTPVEFA